MKHSILVFFLFLCISFRAQELFFTSPTAFKNLPSFETYNTFQDSKGNIWVCTDAGLCRYDGNILKTYTTNDGISENVVINAYEDRKGRVWFCTLSGFFFYFENNTFHPIAANKVLKKYFLIHAPNFFLIGENDTLFCFPYGMTGLLRIPPEENYGKIMLRPITPFINREVYTNKLKAGEVLIGANRYSYQLKNSYTLEWDNKIYKIPVTNFTHYPNYKFGTVNKAGNTIFIPWGLNLGVIKKNDSIVTNFPFSHAVINLYYDKDDDLWISTIKDGVFLYKNADLRSKPLHFLKGLTVSSIKMDREGNIWATTLEKGLFVCYNKGILVIPNKDDKILNFQTDENKIILSYASKKIIHFLKNDSLRMDSLSYHFPVDPYLSIYYNHNGIDYFGTDLKFYCAAATKNIPHTPVMLSTRGIKRIFNYRGDTMIATHSDVLFIFYQQKEILRQQTPFSINFSTKLKDGTILLGSRSNSGIYEFKRTKFIRYLPQFKQLETRINCIVEDRNKNIWIATNENGVYCYDKNGHLYHFNKDNGLNSSKVNYLAVDTENHIWCATGMGLFRIQTTDGLNRPIVNQFDLSHGLPDLQIEKVNEWNGKIWCSTKNHLFYFKTDALEKNATPPLTNIASIFINDKEIPFSDTIINRYDENNIRVTPTLSSYKLLEKRVFIYKLEGYDSEWHSSSGGDIQYTNLNHGTYQLLIYGVNNDGLKSMDPSAFTLIIKRPFWFTWWFIILELIILSLLFIYFLRLWRRRIQKKERDKAVINQQLAEFKMTALRSQMNPHFIYNAIGSIQHYILKNEIDQSFNYLSKFSSLIRKVLNNSRNEFISLEEEVSTLQLYIELEQIRFKHPFQFVLQMDEELDMDIDIPTMLIQPYIENSIWHGLMPKESQGRLELLFKKVDSSIHVTIRDNGVGREKGDLTKKYHISKGMSLTEQRIQTLENTSNKKFVTTVNDLKDKLGNPIGTEVNLIIPFDE